MKNLFLLIFVTIVLIGCSKDDILPVPQSITPELKIESSVGIRLQTPFVTSEVAMNVKSEIAQTATIKIFDIANRVVSKEVVTIQAGDNLLKVYTNALPSSGYRIGLFDSSNRQLAITDFNKL